MYFSQFPVIIYDSVGNDDYKVVTHLLKRVALGSKAKAVSSIFDTYDVRNGLTPEMLADRYYDDSGYHWVVLLVNNIAFNKNYYKESLLGLSENGVKLTRALLNLKNPPTAIICSLDKFFIGCLEECKNQNIVVGKDISVVGYNDYYDNYISSQNLTYISHPLSQMGVDSVNILKKIENGYQPDEVSKLIEPILHEGKSDGPLSK